MTANSEKCHQTLQVVLLGRIWRGICDLEFSDATSRSRDQGPGPDSGERGLVSGAGTDLGETQAAVTTEGRGEIRCNAVTIMEEDRKTFRTNRMFDVFFDSKK